MTSHHRPQRLFIGLSIGLLGLALSGCGSGSSAGSAPPDTRLVQALGLHNVPEQVENTLDKIKESIPRKGSISQSTNIHPDSKEARDRMHIEISGPRDNPLYLVKYEHGAVETTLFSGYARDHDYQENNHPEAAGRQMDLKIGYMDGWPVDIDGDNHHDGNMVLHINTSGYETDDDDDYLASGTWIYAPNDLIQADAEDIVFGAFADVENKFTDTTPLTGEVFYKGLAHGKIIDHRSGGLAGVTSLVNLTAKFYSDSHPGIIYGSVIDIHSALSSEFPHWRWKYQINLEPTTIDNGFFTGQLTGEVLGSPVTGNWGGHFYGNGSKPDGVIGTIGGGHPPQDGKKGVNFTMSFKTN